MKICVLGAGAMGCLLGGLLKRGGGEVYFVDPYEAHMQAICQNGLQLDVAGHSDGGWNIHLDGAMTSSENIGPCDLVIILVKGITTDEILRKNLHLINEKTVVVSFQNGIGNVDIIKKYVLHENIGYGVLKCAARFEGPGKISGMIGTNPAFHDLSYTALIPNSHAADVLNKMAAIFANTKFKAEESNETDALVWDKMYLNCIVNIPLSLLRCSLADGVCNENIIPVLRQIGDEVCAVANAKGFHMDPEQLWEKYIVYIQKNPTQSKGVYTSAVQDTQKKRPTEVDFLNGAVVREGKSIGIATPANEFIWRMGRANVDLYNVQF